MDLTIAEVAKKHGLNLIATWPEAHAAFDEYAAQEAKSYQAWLSNQVLAGRTHTRLWMDYKAEILDQRPTEGAPSSSPLVGEPAGEVTEQEIVLTPDEAESMFKKFEHDLLSWVRNKADRQYVAAMIEKFGRRVVGQMKRPAPALLSSGGPAGELVALANELDAMAAQADASQVPDATAIDFLRLLVKSRPQLTAALRAQAATGKGPGLTIIGTGEVYHLALLLRGGVSAAEMDTRWDRACSELVKVANSVIEGLNELAARKPEPATPVSTSLGGGADANFDGLPEGEYHLSDLENRLYKPFGDPGLPLDDALLIDHVCQYARRLERKVRAADPLLVDSSGAGPQFVPVTAFGQVKDGDSLLIVGNIDGVQRHLFHNIKTKESASDGQEIILKKKGNKYFNFGMYLEKQSWVKQCYKLQWPADEAR